MLGKIWKKVLLIIVLVACLFNIVRKLVHKKSVQEELQATLDYFYAKNIAQEIEAQEETTQNNVNQNQVKNQQKTNQTQRTIQQHNNQIQNTTTGTQQVTQ